MGLAMLVRRSKSKITFVLLAAFVSFYGIIRFRTAIKYKAFSTVDDCKAAFISGMLNTKMTSLTVPLYITNRVRVNKVREYCADSTANLTNTFPDFKRLKDVLLEWTWLASSQHELFYCATPKCGSTTWKSFILEDLRLTWNVDTHVAATQVLGVKTMFQNAGSSLLGFLESYRPANRLIIVRNPWARLVSAYEDKIIDQKWDLKKLCLAGTGYPEIKNITFEIFIDCILKSERSMIWNPHINPLTSLCALCHMDYNLIVKLEEMEEAEPYLLNKLNITRTLYVPPRKLKHKTYKQVYRKIPIEKVRQLQGIYYHDIELFDYPKTPFD